MIRFQQHSIPSAFQNPRPAGSAVRPAGQFAVAAADISYPEPTDGARDAQKFSLLTLQSLNRDILDPNGVVINPSRTGGTITHWMDADLAAAWFAEARRQADIVLAAFFSKNPADDDKAMRAMHSSLHALMNGYNALNIPWYMDPAARALYRKLISGPPMTIAASTTLAEFGSSRNYNDDWMIPQDKYPGYSLGDVQQQMLALVNSVPELACGRCARSATSGANYTSPVPSMSLYIAVPPYVSGTTPQGNGDASYEPTVANGYTLGSFYDPTTGVATDAVLGTQSRLVDSPAGPNLDPNTMVKGANYRSWRTFTWENTLFGNTKRISTPISFYVAFVNSLANSVTSRSVYDIVVAARTYTIYTNISKANATLGGQAAFVGQALGLPSSIFTQETTGDAQNNVRIAATIAATVGAAFSGVTYGISGLIGGAVAAGLTIYGANLRNVPKIAKDDLARYKPLIERGWLSGDPTNPDAIGRPNLSIPAPIGWSRPTISLVPNTYTLGSFAPMPTRMPQNGQPTSQSQPSVVPVTTQTSSGAMFLGLAIAAAVLYVGYRAISPSPSPPRSASRSRRIQ